MGYPDRQPATRRARPLAPVRIPAAMQDHRVVGEGLRPAHRGPPPVGVGLKARAQPRPAVAARGRERLQRPRQGADSIGAELLAPATFDRGEPPAVALAGAPAPLGQRTRTMFAVIANDRLLRCSNGSANPSSA